MEEEGATLVAFCDSNWGSESSTGRKSTSGGVIYVVAGSLWYCVKGYSRLQSVVALSSAEAELFAIAEAAKEIAGLGQLATHIWGPIVKPFAIYTDSASARQIAGMEGFLRRMRHVDIRLCFIQEASRLIFLRVVGPRLDLVWVLFRAPRFLSPGFPCVFPVRSVLARLVG